MDTNIHVRKKDKGYQYVVSYKVNGIWKQKSKQGFKTSREAKLAGQEKEREIKELYIDPDIDLDYTFLSVATMKNIESSANPRTRKNHIKTLSKFKPIFDIKITDLRYKDILPVLTDLKGHHRYSTFRIIFSYGSSVIEYAINKLRISIHNPFKEFSYEPPKISDEREKKAITSTELDTLISGLSGDYKLITAIMGYTGMRISEARGLKREDIDFKNNEITICRQRVSPEGYTNTLKTRNSYRKVPISAKLKAVLREYPLPFDELFPRFISGTSLKYFYKKAGIDLTPHELRHTFVTLLIQKGVDFKTIAMLIGDKVETVLKEYSHVNEDMYQEAKKILLENF